MQKTNKTIKATKKNNNFLQKPVMVYYNLIEEKSQIFSDIKGKCLVYRWVNKINNKSYVGSTVNSYYRFYKYFNLHTVKNPTMAIYKAIIKYGIANFKLEILEFCERENALRREQFYIDYIKPEYNLLKVAGSLLGFKHSEETLRFFKNDRKFSEESRIKLSIAASNRVLTELEKKKLSTIRMGIILSDITKDKISQTITSKIGVPVIVKDLETQIQKSFVNLTQAAKFLNVSRTAVKKCCNNGSLLKKRYEIKLKKY